MICHLIGSKSFCRSTCSLLLSSTSQVTLDHQLRSISNGPISSWASLRVRHLLCVSVCYVFGQIKTNRDRSMRTEEKSCTLELWVQPLYSTTVAVSSLHELTVMWSGKVAAIGELFGWMDECAQWWSHWPNRWYANACRKQINTETTNHSNLVPWALLHHSDIHAKLHLSNL